MIGQSDQVQLVQQFANRFGTHVRFERTGTVLLTGGAILFFGQQLTWFQLGRARVDHHVVLEIDDLFHRTGFHRQQVAQSRWHRFEEPDVDDRRGQFDVPHSLSANARVGDFHTTAVTDHALVFHSTVFTAGALPVLFRSENTLTEQAVFFWTIRSVVDRFWLFDFAERPALDVLWTSQGNSDRCVIVNAIVVAGFANRHLVRP